MKKNLFILISILLTLNTILGYSKEDKDDEFKKFRIGGYGEVLFQSFDFGPNRYRGAGDGSEKLDKNRNQLTIPRYILSTEAKFSKGWSFASEIEFEYGGTGVAIEPEYGEGIEYEYEFEKAGEVVLEQMWLEKSFGKFLKIRAGHQILPLGITNAHHEPIFYLGTTRPEGESTLIPCTWHETGLSVLGSYKNLSYQLMLVNGLDPLGFEERNWIQGGRQTKYESVYFQNPAFLARLDYSSITGMRLGFSAYYAAKTSGNTTDTSETDHFDAPVCRPTWLIEMECIAIKPTNSEYANY